LGDYALGDKHQQLSRLKSIIGLQESEDEIIERKKAQVVCLVQAAALGDLDATRLCLDYGADIDGQSKGYSAIHKAALKGFVEIVQLLVSRGAKVSVRYFKPTSSLYSYASRSPLNAPLHLCAYSLQKLTKKLPVSRGSIDLTILSNKHKAVAVILIEAGADVLQQNKAGQTPLDILGTHADFLRQAKERIDVWRRRRDLIVFLYQVDALRTKDYSARHVKCWPMVKTALGRVAANTDLLCLVSKY
jgi:hypothetical protein